MENPRIHQLDALLANQIAAGEVVERPASVVKELVENSLDAKASKIEVELEGGGTHLIRVRDDGIGIVQADLALAFSRHATSKVKVLQDLGAIASLGFRGEALASIASVAKCRLISKAINQNEAWEIQVGADLNNHIRPASHPQGTTIEVADLFYNTPVRRKFLRNEKTEFQYIDEMLKRLALSHPNVSFRLKHQGRQLRNYAECHRFANEQARMAQICGQSFAENAIHLSMQSADLSLKGWIGSSYLGRRQADCQYFFVNQRMVKDRIISHVIKNVYQQYDLLEGSYPSYVLYLTLPVNELDVNVHPTKQEVRFTQVRWVHDFIVKCLSDALSRFPQVSVSHALLRQKEPDVKRIFDYKDAPSAYYPEEVDSKQIPSSDPIFTGARYVVVNDDKDVVIVDLKKAKSSILAFYFEKHWGEIDSKPLLFPSNFKLNQANFEQARAVLADVGFMIKRIQSEEVALLQQPAILSTVIDESLLHCLLGIIHKPKHEIAKQLGQHLPVDFSKMEKTTFLSLIKSTLEVAPQFCLRLSEEKINTMMMENLDESLV